MSGHFSIWDGAAEQSGLAYSYWDGSTETTGATVDFLPHGLTVSQLLYHQPFVIAHRCGSADWAEMSLRGATESALRGVAALEFSVARSSDGVLFGLHDATLNRTSPSAPANFTVSGHTWAEINAFQCQAPSGGDTTFGAQPYCKLDDFLDAYAGSHTIFLDPKSIGSGNFSAVLDLMDSYPSSTDHFVGKYYGTGTTWADACRARGYKTWGYFYADDIASGTVTSSLVSHWDYLGMEYGAAQSYWTTILSYGKPVIAHIAPTLAAAQTGVSMGAVGVMVSGVRSVMAGT